MFNVEILNDAITELSDAGKAEIQKMVDVFEGYKTEVERLDEIAEASQILAKNLQRDKDNLLETVKQQGKKIEELLKPVES